MLAICVLLVFHSAQEEAALALEIFLISVFGFSLIAVFTYDAVLCWRFVDFPWVCTSFAAIVVALLNIAEVDRREQTSSARSEISRSFSALIYTTQSVVTNDCQELPSRQQMWSRAPEPYDGACDRIKHFLPQMIYHYDEFAGSQDLSSLEGWARNMEVPGATPTGSWSGQYHSAKQFLLVSNKYSKLFEENSILEKEINWSRSLKNFILTTDLKYWYFAMAFFVGFRLSKTAAELLQAMVSRR